MVAIADPSSTAGQAGLVDQSQFAKARDAIRGACDGLLHPNATQQQVILDSALKEFQNQTDKKRN